uniref:F-box domain-containing protein n=1 Tax=Emiliania huxleyi TaxID=2903 RepID=A0A7S3RJU5_EMIHU
MLALLQEVVPIMVASGQNLQANELMRLVSCCRVLRATLQNLELDLSARPSPAPRLLQFIALNAARFQLVSVDVDRCTQEAFDALLLVPGLRALTVRGPASSIRSLAGAERARSLQTLRLLKGVSVALADDLSPLAACRPLTHLCLYGPAPLTSLGPLACCARLESLDLRGCEALVDVEPLVSAGRAACHGLRSLSLRGCRSLRVVSPLRALLALESLDLSCTLVSDVSMLCECPKLKTLTLTGCASLSDVAPLVGCRALDTLYLTGCSKLSAVGCLAECHALRQLHLNKCRAVVDVGALGGCPTLRLLNLRCSGALVVPAGRPGLLVLFDVH